MTIHQIINALTHDKIALSFIFMILPVMAIVTQKAAGGNANKSPFNYIFSIILFVACTTGVISIVLWLHAILFDEKGLWQLNLFVFYLPIIVMVACIFIVKKVTALSDLPWFGELYEVLVLVAISFGVIVVIIEKEWLYFSTGWHIALFFLLLFGMFKAGWERFSRIR